MASQIASPLAVGSAQLQPTLQPKQQRWQAARMAYELFSVPTSVLAELLGIQLQTVERRIIAEKWANKLHEAEGDELYDKQQKLVQKLHQVVEAHFEHVAQLQGDEILGEKKTRALNTLAATIEKLSKLNLKKNVVMGKMNGDGDSSEQQSNNINGQFSPAEIIELREKLANRIEAFVK